MVFSKLSKVAVMDLINELDTNLQKYKELVQFFEGTVDDGIIKSHRLSKKLLKGFISKA